MKQKKREIQIGISNKLITFFLCLPFLIFSVLTITKGFPNGSAPFYPYQFLMWLPIWASFILIVFLRNRIKSKYFIMLGFLLLLTALPVAYLIHFLINFIFPPISREWYAQEAVSFLYFFTSIACGLWVFFIYLVTKIIGKLW